MVASNGVRERSKTAEPCKKKIPIIQIVYTQVLGESVQKKKKIRELLRRNVRAVETMREIADQGSGPAELTVFWTEES